MQQNNHSKLYMKLFNPIYLYFKANPDIKVPKTIVIHNEISSKRISKKISIFSIQTLLVVTITVNLHYLFRYV